MASRTDSSSSKSDVEEPDKKKMKKNSDADQQTDEKSRWSSEDRIDLVNLWESCPELYDYYNMDFHKAERRYEIYLMIGQRLTKKRSGKQNNLLLNNIIIILNNL
jgi:hypothetical protein